MSDPAADPRVEAALHEAEAAEIYAPPREDKLTEAAPPEVPPGGHSPILVGFLTLLFTSTVSSAAAGGLMVLWYNMTPIGGGFLSGLGETILGILCWIALSVFAVLGGLCFAAGILGREGKVSVAGWVVATFFALCAGAICFIPDPKSTFVLRGFLGVLAILVTSGLTIGLLTAARRRFIGPPPPPEWLDVIRA
ncbi:MAG: hypothetical protein R3B70_26630 [Polyangiaceae bacterium]